MIRFGPTANVVMFCTDGRHRRHVQRNAGRDGPPDQGELAPTHVIHHIVLSSRIVLNQLKGFTDKDERCDPTCIFFARFTFESGLFLASRLRTAASF